MRGASTCAGWRDACRCRALHGAAAPASLAPPPARPAPPPPPRPRLFSTLIDNLLLECVSRVENITMFYSIVCDCDKHGGSALINARPVPWVQFHVHYLSASFTSTYLFNVLTRLFYSDARYLKTRIGRCTSEFWVLICAFR